jgi:3-oxoacyl-[acyl-carrier protein] reductase
MKTLEDRVAVVTGAATGIGVGIASVLAAEGARVAIVDRDADAAARAASELDAIALTADVASREQLDAVARDVLARWGRIDILAANAGIFPNLPVEEIDDDVFRSVMDVNVNGALHAIQACLPAMRSQRYGRIVLTSSITGSLVGALGYSVYGASKAAMLGMMRSVALELVPHAVTINAVLPGNVRTGGFAQLDPQYQRELLDSIPMRRLAEPEDIGWAVRFLASEEAAYITGQTLVVDGGQVLPEGLA